MGDYLVFGFGSLINSISRARTLGEVRAWPVRVRGLQRGWYAPSATIRHTALGVVQAEDAVCNGVLALLPAARIEALDARESQYTRTPLPRVHVEALDGPLPPGDIVTYVPSSVAHPTAERPIIRSYVDVTLSGCLEYGQDFAREMLDTTDAWNAHIEDERHAPRYPVHEAHIARDVLDALMRRLRP